MTAKDTVLSGSYQLAVGKKRLFYLPSPAKIEFFACFHSSNGEAGSLLYNGLGAPCRTRTGTP